MFLITLFIQLQLVCELERFSLNLFLTFAMSLKIVEALTWSEKFILLTANFLNLN